jgi:hypothetical protein
VRLLCCDFWQLAVGPLTVAPTADIALTVSVVACGDHGAVRLEPRSVSITDMTTTCGNRDHIAPVAYIALTYLFSPAAVAVPSGLSATL